jgi:uncharacterized protein
MAAMEKVEAAEITRRWISSMVIGLNLCPFAKRVFDADTIRYVVSDVTQSARLLADLGAELEHLVAARVESAETTLLIHPNTLNDFLDFNDFLGVAEELVRDMSLEGVIQIVGFHPDFQFAGTDRAAAENYTNRSPYPMLHLLREQSVSDVAENPDELMEIPLRNIKTLNDLGAEKILERMKEAGAVAPLPYSKLH